MNADMSYSTLPMANKREKLMALIKRRNNRERTPRKKRDDTSSKNLVKESTKPKNLNSHLYKKMFRVEQVKVLKNPKDMNTKDSRHKKQKLCSAQRSSAENNMESGSGELTAKRDHVLNKLRGYAVFDREWLTTSYVVRTKPRSKRKRREKFEGIQAGTSRHFGTHQDETQRDQPPRTNEGQQGQSDQPPLTSSSSPLEKEVERIQKECEQITKSHQEKKSWLLSECEKEISEIQRKYDALIQDSEMSFTREIQILEDYQNLVNVHKLLAEILAQDWHDDLNSDRLELTQNQSDLRRKRKQKEASALNIPNVPASALARPKYPCLTAAPTAYMSAHSLSGPGLSAPAPHLRSNPATFASLPNRPITLEPFLDPLHVRSTTQTLPCMQTESNDRLNQTPVVES